MTLLPSELLLVAGEIAEVLGGRTVQKVVQPGERVIAIGFAGGWLWAAADRRHGRLHLMEEKPPGTGEAATAFCMLLRKELIGLRLAAVEPVLGERAVALHFAREERRRSLFLFLYGGGARIVIADETGHALGSQPSTPPSTEPISLPPPREDARPSRFTREGESGTISSQIARHYAEAVTGSAVAEARAQAAQAVKRETDRLRRKEAALEKDLVRVASALTRRKHADLILTHLSTIPRGASKVTLSDDYTEGGGAIEVALDPAKSPQENAARLYHEYKRLARGRAAVEQRLADTRAERARAEARLAAILTASEPALAALIPATLNPAALNPAARNPAARNPAATESAPQRTPSSRAARAKSDTPRRPFRSFTSTSGAAILVGKGADKNDELTFRVARGNDLWMHTRDVPGAHVVVPLAGRPVDEITLIDAAMLAVWFSPARPAELSGLEITPAGAAPAQAPEAQADVTYALRKFVRKPKNAPPGRVSVTGGKTVRVRMEPDRLRRLLASRSDE